MTLPKVTTISTDRVREILAMANKQIKRWPLTIPVEPDYPELAALCSQYLELREVLHEVTERLDAVDTEIVHNGNFKHDHGLNDRLVAHARAALENTK